MAIVLPKMTDKVEVVLSFDSALNMSDEDFELYKESGYKKELLTLKEGEEPTYFVLKRVLSYAQESAVTSKKLDFVDGRVKYDHSSSLEVVRAALVDVINPESVPLDQRIVYKKDSDGSASKELVALLASAGAVDQLFAAYQSVAKGQSDQLKKK